MSKLVAWTIIALCAQACSGGAEPEAKQQPHDAGEVSGLQCGKEICRSEGADAGEPCCADRFAGGCGTLIAGICRISMHSKDGNCPEVDVTSAGWPEGTTGTRAGIPPCCASNNECGVNLGIGFGCTPMAQACGVLPPSITGSYPAQTCDGKRIELPPVCYADAGPEQ